MIRGFEYVGCLRDFISWEYELAVDGDLSKVRAGDILCVASLSSGPLRCGSMQVAHVGEDIIVTRQSPHGSIPAICSGDHIFVARAIGEHAFKRAS